MKATPEQLRRILREHLECLTDGLKRGRMMEPYNYSHFSARLAKLGIDYPKNVFDYMAWAEENGLNRLLKKMAKQGHWVKGAK